MGLGGMSCPEPNLVKTLTAKHARLQGLALRDGPEKHMLDLYHVECVIRMFAPDWTPAKPIAPRSAFTFGKRGAMANGALAVLRAAQEPLTARQIAVALLAKAGRDEPDLIWPIMRRLLPYLGKRIGKGIVRSEGRPWRWALEGKIVVDSPFGSDYGRILQ
jgi:hypothetical protein